MTGSTMTRAAWFVRTGAVPATWLLLAVVAGLWSLAVDVDGWLPVHLLLLGAVSNAILVWSPYFANAVLRTPDDGRPSQVQRLIVFNVGAIGVIEGMVYDALPMVALGATLVAAVALWHAGWLVRRLRVTLPARFSGTVRYYVAASLLLVLGVGLGVAREYDVGGDALADRLVVAHLSLNAVGWIALTVLGTLVTLWPTMLRTQMEPAAERPTVRALPWLVLALLVSAAGALLDLPAVAAVGILAFVVVLVPASLPLWQEARRKPPYDFATRSVAAACSWLLLSLLGLMAVAGLSSGWDAALAVIEARVLPALVLGFAGQVLLGALTYLTPVVLGGGPAAARSSIARVERWGMLRLVLFNAGLVLAVVASGPARAAGLVVCGLCLVATVALVAGAALARRRAAASA